MFQQIFEHCEGFWSELYSLGASPQARVRRVKAIAIEEYTFFVRHLQSPKSTDLRQAYCLQHEKCSVYCACLMERWQHNGEHATICDIVGSMVEALFRAAFIDCFTRVTKKLPHINSRIMTFLSMKR